MVAAFAVPQEITAQTFAVIGDFGKDNQNELDVSLLVKSWNPEFIVTVGDNNYPTGDYATIDNNVGKYYQEFIYPYTGSYGPGSTVNKFFPALGNHDVMTNGGQPYFDYFTLPNNERYYDFIEGGVHFFILNSNVSEPDGNYSTSIQGQWLQNKLASSAAIYKLVCLHHSPYSSDTMYGPEPFLQWPFQQWGATAVISGHSHSYERLIIGGFPYFVNGLGGVNTSIYGFGPPVPGSMVRYNADNGAMLVTANPDSLVFEFVTRTGLLIDRYVLQSASLGIDNKPGNVFSAGESYPNPFGESSKIDFSVPVEGNVRIEVYNILGIKVATLADKEFSAGKHTVEWLAERVNNGIYFYRISYSGHELCRYAVISR